jgi:alkaline phosphatase isozyme conversion protein
MLSALRHRTAALALGVCFIFSAQARAPHPGEFASNQARHIATYFPGRMTGTCRNARSGLPSPAVCADGLSE